MGIFVCECGGKSEIQIEAFQWFVSPAVSKGIREGRQNRRLDTFEHANGGQVKKLIFKSVKV
jgi:hypothetical protein